MDATSIEGAKHLDVEEDGARINIVCLKTRRQDLDPAHNEDIDMRIFYWAAYYGNEALMGQLVKDRRWSPFIKSYKNRSIISGAIWGNKTEIVRYLLGNFKFNEIHADQKKDFAATVFNKDSHDNNCLHYCYM